MRFAIMGSGGLGCLFGGLLARAGLDVTLIARGVNLDALQQRGLDVILLSGERFHVDVKATDNPADVGPVDAVMFCVKSYDIESAAEACLPMVGPETLFLPVQNGVEAAERIAAVVGAEHVMNSAGLTGGTVVTPGVVEQKSPVLKVRYGPYQHGVPPMAERILEALRLAGFDAAITPDIEMEVWEKYLSSVGGLTFGALTRLPASVALTYPETAEVFLGLMREAVAIGRAQGIPYAENAAETRLEQIRANAAKNPSSRGSMQYDLMAGKRIEVEAIAGYIVRKGRELGIPTPYNQVIYGGLKPYADGPPPLPD